MSMIRIYYVKRQNYWLCRVFVGRDTGNLCGTLVFSEREFEDARAGLAGVEWINDEQREAA